MLKYLIAVLATMIMTLNQTMALDAITLSYGQGEPAQLRTAMLGAQWELPNSLYTCTDNWNVIGLADVQIGYWSVNKLAADNKSLASLAVIPTVRIQKYVTATNVTPYLEAGVGPAMYTQSKLGGRDLGAIWGLQNKLGFGLMFGESNQYDVSYHYVNASNYGLYSSNDGFAANWLISFAFRFK